ncbi:toll/interleukin-1 receptor domain-containing protein [Sphingomonas sp. LM7]|uniref:toll/interleukin-1 receptor domain-containing protein n=1 Tax=Sphingomonas sp. LM7 TaxID=1938607 RepID=UPI000983F4A0|nr:toll/interleukin-1 receptor domain-containing protein [Sphingomonas sp. LM7]AQR72381.1 hypothetical protein BXU08_00695 [Sphingomonas sp. LM7]
MAMTMAEPRYAAFLSYSHADAATARWLHRKLEGYRVPRRLIGTIGERGLVPARLIPIFRDREELPAAGDLSSTVRAALQASSCLIVLCSRDAAASQWVGREIETFRTLHPNRPILAVLLDGAPGDCFPSALHTSRDGAAVEPLAADLRRGGDGRSLGFLKLVAGVTGTGVDALVQRDAARKLRRVTAVTLVALVATLVMAVLTIIALDARREAERQGAEAERQRAEAEGLVEFMLTDLREKLSGEVRLKVLGEVNQRAFDHYAGQDLSALGTDELERRARLLHAMGEDDGKRGMADRALATFGEAYRTTEALLAAAPNDARRIFAHAQSEYWVGYNAFERRDFANARRAWERYDALAKRLVAIDPSRREWRKEAGFAQGNLCTIALQKPVSPGLAVSHCSVSLDHMKRATHASDAPEDLRSLANRHGWLADALQAAGRLESALAHREEQHAIAEHLLAKDPQNAKLRASRLWAIRGVATMELALGRTAAARRKLAFVEAELIKLVRFDPDNSEWKAELLKIRATLSQRNHLQSGAHHGFQRRNHPSPSGFLRAASAA